MFSRVVLPTLDELFSTLDTVRLDTPASLATSLIVVFFLVIMGMSSLTIWFQIKLHDTACVARFNPGGMNSDFFGAAKG